MEEKFYLEKDRISVFIGKNGSEKKFLEEKFNCKIDVDSETGEVLVEGSDALSNFILSNIISAINYGHSPKHAINLENEHNVLDVIDVKTQIKDSHRVKTVLGRIIGKNGSTREVIEEITKCNVAVKGNYVSIIGSFENVQLVHEALQMLIMGSSHKSFYSYLERNKVNHSSLM